jgi:lipoprotein-anchoring transpeptidase ErfK/SrfK
VAVRRSVASRPPSPAGKTCFPNHTAFFNLWRVAVVASVGFVAAAPTKAAAWGLWPDYYEPYVPPRPVYARKPLSYRLPKHQDTAKDTRKPHGPLIIAISIQKQLLRVYDANGTFAETPVSTGMRGHATPMGVFSVIQKHKYHHSNIYSGAPMPYMQRITWSGVAMHAGVLPGYPASHGCIRMPMSFAGKLWGWTRMGARVVIAPGELAPESISYPLLATHKGVPVAIAEPANKVEVATEAKSDQASVADLTDLPSFSETSLGLKSTLGHPAWPASGAHTADASSVLSPAGSPRTIVDAPISGLAMPAEAAAADAGPAAPYIAKDQGHASEPEQAAKPEPAAATKRSGPIAVFISKTDGKVYVRQNFAPLFDAPLTVAADDRPLGTHVFTAMTDKEDASLLRWSVVSMPAVKAASMPDSAAEALARLTIPADAMARINEALSSGASIVVSDQGINGGETGWGTDFIIPLR